MKFLSSLRGKWRQHDEELAERELNDPNRLNPIQEPDLLSAEVADSAAESAVESEEALEHEEPA